MRSKSFYAAVVVFALALTGVWVFLKTNQQAPEDVVVTPPVIADLVVEQDWISFSVPKEVRRPIFDIVMDVRKPLDHIDVLWNHSAVPDTDPYRLKSFQSGNSEAIYKISPLLGNLLPGDNSYEVVGVKLKEDGETPEQEFRVVFTISFDIKNYPEINPRFFTFDSFPSESGDTVVPIRGALQLGVEQVRVYSFHSKVGKATFTPLNKYVPKETSFEYFIDEKLGNFFVGDNEFVIEAVDQTGEVVARKYFSVRSSKMTLGDEVSELFGAFTLVKGGWFVSEKLPWFSIRPVYESIWIADEEGKVVVPRPTLMYTTESSLETQLCDYLKSIDYEKENYSYRGYSYETCQKYRFGVSVYDRFLSILEYQPFELVKRTEYKNIEGIASSAFVMIETGGMEKRETAISFDEKSFSDDSEKTPAEDTEATPEKFYLYQMMITQGVDYPEKKIGDIAEEMSAEQRVQVEQVRAFLNGHSGDELFSDLLFPEEEEMKKPSEGTVDSE